MRYPFWTAPTPACAGTTVTLIIIYYQFSTSISIVFKHYQVNWRVLGNGKEKLSKFPTVFQLTKIVKCKKINWSLRQGYEMIQKMHEKDILSYTRDDKDQKGRWYQEEALIAKRNIVIALCHIYTSNLYVLCDVNIRTVECSCWAAIMPLLLDIITCIYNIYIIYIDVVKLYTVQDAK